MKRLSAAFAVALVAFLLYRSTLLAGFDFGDTPSFQVMGGEGVIQPRDAYPLYFAIGDVFVRLIGDRAHALNVASAVEAAVATGLTVIVAAELAGTTVPAVAAALLLAGSYTFWSQAVITEVYALHACLVLLTLLLLLRWERSPTWTRLAWFFSVYALGFGNHLAMILLLPGYTLFLLASAPGGWRSMFAPRTVALAVALAVAGALPYLWNLRGLWLSLDPPRSLAAGAATFWFDVTKSDWRDTMLVNIPRTLAAERLRMYAFDLRQQFGSTGPIVAAVGLVQLARVSPRRAWLMGMLFAVNVLFALSYNVGDSHVFFLPSHTMLALLVAPGLVFLDALLPLRAPVVSALIVLLACGQIYRNYPALDRSSDTRPADLIRSFTADLDDRHDVLITDLGWQIDNGLNYVRRVERRDLATTRLADILLYAPALVRDNTAIGRRIILTASARDMLAASYGPLFSIDEDPTAHATTLVEATTGLTPGTRYALAVLKPTHEFALDWREIDEALAHLTTEPDAAADTLKRGDYAVLVGTVGGRPDILDSSARPFVVSSSVGGVATEVRMESWLAFDTIRRMGFGQVVAGRRHTLIVERGVSFAAFDDNGRPIRLAYAANIFEPQQRYVVRLNQH